MKIRQMFCKWVPVILSWWLIFFPEVVFCSGMCVAYESENGAVKQISMDPAALRELLFRAAPDQIEYKSLLWEMVSGGADHAKEG